MKRFPTSCQDTLVSQEFFQLKKHPEHTFLQTTPQPSIEALPKYYLSSGYRSHNPSKINVIDYVYGWIQRRNNAYKLKQLNQFRFSGNALLDVGAGTGGFCVAAQKRGWQCLAIEPSEIARQYGQRHAVAYVDWESIKDHSLDCITLWHVLEHLPNLDNVFKEFERTLKPNGLLVIAVPNWHSWDAQHYFEHWAAYDVPRHLWHFDPESLKALLQKYSWRVDRIFPLPYDAYYAALLSENNRKSFLPHLQAFFKGFYSNWKAKRNQQHSSFVMTAQKRL